MASVKDITQATSPSSIITFHRTGEQFVERRLVFLF